MLTKNATSLNFHVTVRERGGGRRDGDIERKDRGMKDPDREDFSTRHNLECSTFLG